MVVKRRRVECRVRRRELRFWRRRMAAAVVAVVSALGLGVVAGPTQASAATVGYCPEMTDSVTRLYSAYYLRLSLIHI